jgi:hypothetical protein
MWANNVFHLSWSIHFCPLPSGEAGQERGAGGKPLYVSTKQGKNLFTAKTQPFIGQLSASQTSEHFLTEVKVVAFCM